MDVPHIVLFPVVQRPVWKSSNPGPTLSAGTPSASAEKRSTSRCFSPVSHRAPGGRGRWVEEPGKPSRLLGFSRRRAKSQVWNRL